MISNAPSSKSDGSLPSQRLAWWPVALLVALVFGLSLGAWAVFFKLGSTIDTHRLEPTEVPALLQKHASQNPPPAP